MRSTLIAAFLLGLLVGSAIAATGPEPKASIAPPKDQPYPGVIRLSVDATDTERRIFRVHETVPVSGGQEVVLLYPEWLPGTHAPEGRSRINRFAGLVVTVNGTRIDWIRDPAYVYAFHITAPEGAVSLDIDFQYLSPVGSQAGGAEVSADILVLQWSSVVLYPAGYFARGIGIEASVKLPEGWQLATALDQAPTSGPVTSFSRVPLETLVDSPIFAGRYAGRWDLDPDATSPVRLHMFADRPELLAVKPEQLASYRSLIQQAYQLFGSKHYDHYDFLVTLSDNIRFGGLEHHRSSENATFATSFSEWDKAIVGRDLLPHEYVHSWNGKFRRPADLWTPNYNEPMRNSLLWVYEGLTEYWGQVLAARAALWTKEQALDALASIAAYYQAMAGRTWRPVQDTTSDEIINPREQPLSWASWQRYEDYYTEGLLIWLDADTLIRELSQGEHSLDDFARGFFGSDDARVIPLTYTLEDVVTALNGVQPYDWAGFLHARLAAINPDPPFDGITRGGYRLVFNDTAGEYYKSAETRRKLTNLTYSLGLSVANDGNIRSVLWDGPAFKAGLSTGVQIIAVNGIAFDADRLKDAIKSAQIAGGPTELIVKQQNQYRVVRIDYHNGLRYPHLERDTAQPARLDEILTARK